MRPRKLRGDTPSYVETAVRTLEPYLKDAVYRRVNDNVFYWRIIYGAVQLDAARIAMLMDMRQELGADFMVINISQQSCWVSIDFYKKSREDGGNQ